MSFFDCADIDAGKIPKYAREDKEPVKKLPLFFRTMAGDAEWEQTQDRLRERLKGIRNMPPVHAE